MVERLGVEVYLSIGRPKDKKNDDSVLLQRVLGPHYIHKVDEKTDIDTDVDLKLLPHSHLIDIEYKAMEG
jgi:hypothetical protein